MKNGRMLFVFLLILIALAATGVFEERPAPPQECPGGVCPVEQLERYYQSVSRPVVDLAPQLRQQNWTAAGQGSCVHATTISLLRWQKQYELAEAWRGAYGGGEYSTRHEQKLKSSGVRYVMTDDGDERLLEFALATRRGCGVTWPPGHCVALVGKEDGQAVILDNNSVGKYRTLPWDRFVREWKDCGGWAFVMMYLPPPPVPE